MAEKATTEKPRTEDKPKYEKPLPEFRPETKRYWDACKKHELVLPKCNDCGQLFFYPRALCPNCMSQNLDWVKVSGKGKVWTFSIHHMGPTSAYKNEPPYVVALVETQEGPKIMTNIVDCKPQDVRIGTEVEVVFEDVTPEVTLPKFKPVKR